MSAHFLLAAVYANTGRLNEAIVEAETCVNLSGRSTLYLATLSYYYARSGRVAEARRLLEELQGLAKKAYVSPSSFSIAHAGLGDVDKFFVWLNKAVDEFDPFMIHAHLDPGFDPVRCDPCFQAILRKINLKS